MSDAQGQQQPTFSPDGSHYWDGSEWVPVPTRRSTKRKPSLRVQILRPLIIVGVLLAGVIGWNVIQDRQQEQDVQDYYCEHFGNRSGDPDCP